MEQWIKDIQEMIEACERLDRAAAVPTFQTKANRYVSKLMAELLASAEAQHAALAIEREAITRAMSRLLELQASGKGAA